MTASIGNAGEQQLGAVRADGGALVPPRRVLPLLLALRPKQFIKNGVVFAAFIFTVRLAWRPLYPDTWLPLLGRSLLAFAAFCAVSAAGYLVNDLHDVAADRLHPRKRLRPIVSGALGRRAAVIAALIGYAAGLAAGAALGWRFEATLAGYALLTLAYTFALKQAVILDVLVIAAGFALRAMAGAFAIAVPVSPWLYLCTVLGALLLAVNKRRHELLLLDADAIRHRPALAAYSLPLLDQMSSTVAAATVIAYSLYTFTAENLPKNHAMMVTVPFVLYGVFRYLFLVYRRDEGGSPDELLVRDLPLLACLALWLLTAAGVLAIYR
ncbi:MAG TPA: decaprenyl-phosphate phosphoribosyltransferase [Dehalococcoidia bacterium]|nr:decaprenyl-phosphate phosphoribosyltransferase [Dehalococcoidia bacterium]